MKWLTLSQAGTQRVKILSECFLLMTHSNHNSMKTEESVHEGKQPFKCNICDYCCSQKSDVASVHEGKKPFKSGICKYSSSQKQQMNRHIVSVHENKFNFRIDLKIICSATLAKLTSRGGLQHVELDMPFPLPCCIKLHQIMFWGFQKAPFGICSDELFTV